MTNLKHAFEVIETQRKDGDFNAVVIKLGTGDAGVATKELYRHVIDHNLGRAPVGCQIIMSSAICNVCVIDKNENNITIKFDTARVDVNLRIW